MPRPLLFTTRGGITRRCRPTKGASVLALFGVQRILRFASPPRSLPFAAERPSVRQPSPHPSPSMSQYTETLFWTESHTSSIEDAPHMETCHYVAVRRNDGSVFVRKEILVDGNLYKTQQERDQEMIPLQEYLSSPGSQNAALASFLSGMFEYCNTKGKNIESWHQQRHSKPIVTKSKSEPRRPRKGGSTEPSLDDWAQDWGYDDWEKFSESRD